MGFENPLIDADAIRGEAEAFFAPTRKWEHAWVFRDILDSLEVIDFRELGELKPDQPIPQKTKVVLTVEQVLNKARELNCGLCQKDAFVYAFNGEY